jgi:hypothetical protein
MALGAFWVWAKYVPHWMGSFSKICKFGFLSPILYELSTLAAPPPYLQHATASSFCKRSVFDKASAADIIDKAIQLDIIDKAIQLDIIDKARADIQLDIIDKVLDISDMDKFVTRYLFFNAGMIIT